MRTTEIAREVSHADIEMVAVALEGLTLLTEGAVAIGMERLDKASAAASSGEMSDVNAIRLVGCYQVTGCSQIRDLARPPCDGNSVAADSLERHGRRRDDFVTDQLPSQYGDPWRLEFQKLDLRDTRDGFCLVRVSKDFAEASEQIVHGSTFKHAAAAHFSRRICLNGIPYIPADKGAQ